MPCNAERHLEMPQRPGIQVGAVEGIIDAILIHQSYHLMRDPPDRCLEEGWRTAEVAVPWPLCQWQQPRADQRQVRRAQGEQAHRQIPGMRTGRVGAGTDVEDAGWLVDGGGIPAYKYRFFRKGR